MPQRLQNGANDRQTFGRLGGHFRHPKSATCLPLSGSCFGYSGRPKILKVTQNEPNDRQTFGRLDDHFRHPKSAICLPLSGSCFGHSGRPNVVQGRQNGPNADRLSADLAINSGTMSLSFVFRFRGRIWDCGGLSIAVPHRKSAALARRL